MKYRLRADCATDVMIFLQKARGKIRPVKMVFAKDVPDVELTFKSKVSLQCLKCILDDILDGHVMSETICRKIKYTGERQ